MTTIPQLSETIGKVLGSVANEVGIRSGFVQRRSKISAEVFTKTLVLGWLSNPEASLGELTQMAAALGVKVSSQGLDQRFGEAGAECLRGVLDVAVESLIRTDPVTTPILNRFNGVYVADSSVVTLPDELGELWPGCGGRTTKGTESSVKLQVCHDLNTGELKGPYLQPGKTPDTDSVVQRLELPEGALRIADLGYHSLQVMGDLDDEDVYWLSRLHPQTVVLNREGERQDLLALLDSQGDGEINMEILLGANKRLPCRLVGVRVSMKVANERRRRLNHQAKRKWSQGASKTSLALADWTILVTNAPGELLSVDDALILSRVRWQIELLFKLWKSYGRIDKWRSANPWRILCELYAKLIAMLIQHWVMLVGCWKYPDRSLVKGSQTVRNHALMMAIALAGAFKLSVAIEWIHRALSYGCRMNLRRAKPNSHQLLIGLSGALA